MNNIVVNGYCGKNVIYTFYDDGTLVLNGTGPMIEGYAPFAEYDRKIKKIIIGKDVTYIGSFVFRYCNWDVEIISHNSNKVFIGIESLPYKWRGEFDFQSLFAILDKNLEYADSNNFLSDIIEKKGNYYFSLKQSIPKDENLLFWDVLYDVLKGQNIINYISTKIQKKIERLKSDSYSSIVTAKNNYYEKPVSLVAKYDKDIFPTEEELLQNRRDSWL